MGENIFPFISYQEPKEYVEEKKIPKEFAWDFGKNQFILENGRMKILEGAEALKVWICKMLKTQRYRYLIYSWNYGSELEKLIGAGYASNTVRNEVKRLLEDALQVNSGIKGTKNVNVTFSGDKLDLSFTVITDYGEVKINV
ncbi:DUF2634 domain-containing protein [Ruminiclostridium cellobioparum]|uniref:DUF2634 domain-containing protein n=1 Tax=Ruminiclostridium cellobioparum TaxID=29355 RepID=UPI00048095FC|nr:DUF2634 domain-containing protein [Ruminiclostridium cellobioparum]